MRELKFRIWNNETKRMGKTFSIHEAWNTYNEEGAPPKDMFIMQFTGLLDKNGREIYEGDVVKWLWNGDIYKTGKVIFERGCFMLENYKNGLFDGKAEMHWRYDDWEVIGNIYESPGLLKDK